MGTLSARSDGVTTSEDGEEPNERGLDLSDGGTYLRMRPINKASVDLLDGGVFTDVLLVGVIESGVGLFDIGRFARQHDVSATDLLAATKNACSKSERAQIVQGFLSTSPPKKVPASLPDLEGRSREIIPTGIGETRHLVAWAWRCFSEANSPAPQMFTFGDSLSWVHASGDRDVTIYVITKDRMIYAHHRIIRWEKMVPLIGPVETEPPKRVTDDMLASPHPPLPRLVGVRGAPVFGPSGKLAINAGYDNESQMFIWPRNLVVPFVPSVPTPADVAEARRLVEYELLGQFPFESDADMAHAIAAMLHPFVRPMIVGPTPMALIDKPTPGTGGTLLANAIAIPALGNDPSVMSVGKLEDEWRFRMVALLRTGPAIVLLDNINVKLDSATLAAMITTFDTYADRVIRSSDIVTIPIRCQWMATGNNVVMSSELIRRSFLIRLDANEETPEIEGDYRHPLLVEWAMTHRAELVWALLVLVQNWIARGRPKGAQKPPGSFESWGAVIGGILEAAGIPGFLANAHKLQQHSDPDADAWRSLVDEWSERFGTKTVRAGELLSIAQEHLSDLGNHGRSQDTTWGALLMKKRDAVIAGKKILYKGTKQGAAQWQLQPIGPKEPS